MFREGPWALVNGYKKKKDAIEVLLCMKAKWQVKSQLLETNIKVLGNMHAKP